MGYQTDLLNPQVLSKKIVTWMKKKLESSAIWINSHVRWFMYIFSSVITIGCINNT